MHVGLLAGELLNIKSGGLIDSTTEMSKISLSNIALKTLIKAANSWPTLNSVGLNIMPWDHCEAMSSYQFFQFSKNVEFCAGTPDKDGDGLTDSGAGTCHGDQGLG